MYTRPNGSSSSSTGASPISSSSAASSATKIALGNPARSHLGPWLPSAKGHAFGYGSFAPLGMTQVTKHTLRGVMAETIKCISPVDGRIYASRRVATKKEIAAAFAAAHAAQEQWKRLPIAERGACCSAAVDAMIAMTEEIVPELAWQMGRPVRYGGGELRGFEERARYMISIAEAALSDLDPGPKEGFVRYVKRTPLGVVFTIAPWNYPYLTAVNSIIPALMAGNALVLKHAASTLLVAERLQQAFDRAKLQKGVFQHLVLDHKQTAEIIAGGHTNMVCFTG